jgi:DNA-binding NarL/FixJ family response regulator
LSASISCVVADDHPAVVESVARFLRESGIDVVGTALTGEEAVRLVAQLRPRVAVVDLRMPDVVGINVALRVAEASPETAVLIFTGQPDQQHMADILDSGLGGMIVKDAPLSELVRAVGMVASGLAYVDPTLAEGIVRRRVTRPRQPLTDSERECVRLLADGLGTSQIAGALGTSPEQADATARAAMRKLGAETRAEAVATALRRCIIT